MANIYHTTDSHDPIRVVPDSQSANSPELNFIASIHWCGWMDLSEYTCQQPLVDQSNPDIIAHCQHGDIYAVQLPANELNLRDFGVCHQCKMIFIRFLT